MAKPTQKNPLEVGKETQKGDKFNVPLVFTLLDRGDPVQGETINFYDNGSKLPDDGVTDENGIAGIIAKDLDAGTHTFIGVVRGKATRGNIVKTLGEPKAVPKSAPMRILVTQSQIRDGLVRIRCLVLNEAGKDPQAGVVLTIEDPNELGDVIMPPTNASGRTEVDLTVSLTKKTIRIVLDGSNARYETVYRDMVR